MNALDLTNPNLLKLNYKLSCFETHQIIMMMNDADQMIECFAEMERLKVKMETLEQQRKNNEENETLRKTTMEPNLKVLENWLVDYREAIEDEKEKINKKATEQKKSNVINCIKQYINMINRDYNQFQPSRRQITSKYQAVDFNELEKMSLSLQTDPYNVLQDKMNKIKQIYEYGNYFKLPQSKEEIAASHIEATYNMFNIINKRLDDIDKKLALFDYENELD